MRPSRFLATALMIASSASPLAAAQATQSPILDSAAVVLLVMEVDRDLSAATDPNAFRQIRIRLERAAAHFGIELSPIPGLQPEVGNSRSWLETEYRTRGLTAALEGAERLNREQSYNQWHRFVWGIVAADMGLIPTLTAALEAGRLEDAIRAVLSAHAVNTAMTEVLAWSEAVALPEDLRADLVRQAIEMEAIYRPAQGWDLAERLPSPDRERIRLAALGTTSGDRAIPPAERADRASALLADIRAVGAEELLPQLANVCLASELSLCVEESVEEGFVSNVALSTMFLNHMGAGEWGAALDRLQILRERFPVDSVRLFQANALGSVPNQCSWRSCDMIAFDSIFRSWAPVLDSTSATMTGPLADEVHLHMARAWATRSIERTAWHLESIADERSRDSMINQTMQYLPKLNLVEAWTMFVRLTAPGADSWAADYEGLLAAGRPDLAEAVLERSGGRKRFELRFHRGLELYGWGRGEEARALMLQAISEWDPQDALSGLGGVTRALLGLDLLDVQMEKVRSSGLPEVRAAGILTIVEDWIGMQAEQTRQRRGDAIRLSGAGAP